MPTLSQATREAKSILKWGAILLGLLIAIFSITRIVSIIKQNLTPPPLPTVAFGKLPSITFPDNKNNKKFSYSIDTIAGFLPTLPDRIQIYRIEEEKPDLLAFDKMQSRVSKVGFTSNSQVAENTYQWTDNSTLSRKITANIFSTQSFNLSSSFLTDTPIQPIANFLDQNGAINTSEKFLSDMSYLPNDLDVGKTKTSLFSIKDGVLNPTTNSLNAKIIRVDFFQGNVNKLPIYYDDPYTSVMTLFVAVVQAQPQIVQANFNHQSIAKDSEDYPLKTIDEAYAQLKKGKAYISSYSGNDTNILIKNVILGYYIGKDKQDYLMPIIVFEGNNGFWAYVLAIKDEWISK